MGKNKQNNNAAKGGGLLNTILGGAQQCYSSGYGKVYDYYISGEIGDAEDYCDWFQQIRSARDSDVLRFHINSPGGNLFTTIQLIQAMVETDAHIICSVEGACMSAATLIFLSGDEYSINRHSMFMFHNYSGATIGKGGEMFDHIVHEKKWSEKLLKDFYEDFLTIDEIQQLLDNKDLWMDTEEVIQRLENRSEETKRKYEERMAKANEEAKAEAKSTRRKRKQE